MEKGHWKKIKKGQKAGAKNSDGYILIRVNGKTYYAHRMAFIFTTGKFPENEVDHINGITSDNRISNLRECSHKQNIWNQKIRKNNTSGIKGVSWFKRYNKWRARFIVNGKYMHIGYFNNKEDAEITIKKYMNIHQGEFATNRK
jgi:HNH endonuclease/AP2 domain